MSNIDLKKAVFTVRKIMTKTMPILYVFYDTDDEWQFLTGEDVDLQEMMMVTWNEIKEIDPSVAVLNLEVGYEAVRKDVSSQWFVRRVD